MVTNTYLLLLHGYINEGDKSIFENTSSLESMCMES